MCGLVTHTNTTRPSQEKNIWSHLEKLISSYHEFCICQFFLTLHQYFLVLLPEQRFERFVAIAEAADLSHRPRDTSDLLEDDVDIDNGNGII